MKYDEDITNPEVYDTCVEDLAEIIASQTAGYFGARPEADDYEFAKEIKEMIDTRYLR